MLPVSSASLDLVQMDVELTGRRNYVSYEGCRVLVTPTHRKKNREGGIHLVPSLFLFLSLIGHSPYHIQDISSHQSLRHPPVA